MTTASRIVLRFVWGSLLAVSVFGAAIGESIPAAAETEDAGAQANPNLIDLGPRVRLAFVDPEIRDFLSTAPPKIRTVGRFPQVLLEVTSQTSSPVGLEYRVRWFDQDDFPVAPYSSWFLLLLNPNEPKAITSTGRKPTAHRAQIALRLQRQ